MRALTKVHPKAQVSVATTANVARLGDGSVASDAGADRIFLMGYDYHWSGSAPGASSPIDRRDGDEKDLVWSLDMYEALGVPVERTILGLPLYGMAWPVVGARARRAEHRQGLELDPERPSRLPGRPGQRGHARRHRAGRAVPHPELEPRQDPRPERVAVDFTAIYVDSPATLTPKMALADARGLAGVGFWAIGYDRGLPGYAALIKQFRAGKLD